MKPLKIITILSILFFISCSKDDDKSGGENNQSASSACNLIANETFIKEFYPDATGFKYEIIEEVEGGCFTRFNTGGESAGFTIAHVKRAGSENSLDFGTSVFKDREPANNVGKKAYYIPKINQVSVWLGNDLLHITLGIPSTNDDKEQAIKITQAIIDKLY